MNTILQTINLKKYYGEGENIVKAIDNTNINIFQGEFVAIVGKSGSGKSTLLHMLGALDKRIEKEYLIGRYGAIPDFSKLDSIEFGEE